MKQGNGFIVNSIKGIGIMFHAEPKMLLLQCSFAIAHGLSWALQVVFTQKFFDAAQNLVQRNIDYYNCFFAMLGMILAYAFCQVMNGVDNCHARILSLAIAKHTNLQIFKRIDQLGCIEFEDTKRLDYINKAMNGGGNIVWVCLTLIDTIFFYTTYFVSMAFYLFTLKPILCVSILAIFIPCLLSNIIQIRTFRDLEEASAPIRRECDYYEECVSDIKETRFWGVTAYFKKLYYICLKKLNNLTLRAQLRKNFINLALDCITVLGYGAILFMIFIFVLRQEISIGAFAAVLASIGRLFSFMSEVISERIGWASENVATLENYISFITEKSETESSKTHSVNKDIVFKKVSFSYPLSEKRALNNINLIIKQGQTLAIVGENGSGKTTLCRLILGIYPPTIGDILVGENSIKNVNHDNDSAIFQNYCRYKMTIKENICISRTDQNTNDEEIKAICKESGVNINDEKLNDGLNTMLGRDFDGVELSGGQWQRVAIARGLFRTSDLIVLDEPTSAIDPLEETSLYNEFINICQNKTAVIVTHRLGSVKIADRIIVLKDGYIVEDGTHTELIELDGEYKRMFDAQSQWYGIKSAMNLD